MAKNRLLDTENRISLIRYWINNAVLTGDSDVAMESLSKALENLVAIEVMVRDEIRDIALSAVVRAGKERLKELSREHIEADSEHIEADSEHIEADSEHDRDEVT